MSQLTHYRSCWGHLPSESLDSCKNSLQTISHCNKIIIQKKQKITETTLCLKKVPIFKLSVTLSNLNRFSKFLRCWKACEICYKKRHKITHFTLGMLLHYLWISKIQIFCKYSADIKKCKRSAFSVHKF